MPRKPKGTLDPKVKLATQLREAYAVKRFHCVPQHGQNTVGQHTVDMLSLLFVLYPGEPRMNLVKAVMFHDVPERWTGDIPAPAKRANGELGRHIHDLDRRVLKSLGLQFKLTPEEMIWLHALDRLECFLWARDQQAMGNVAANAVAGDLLASFASSPLPKPIVEFLGNHRWTRNSDTLADVIEGVT